MPTSHRVSSSRRRRVVSLLVVGGLLVTSCGNSGDNAKPATPTTAAEGISSISGVPGVTDSEIHFAVLATGVNTPTGACILACYASGIKAYFAFRNSQGGVDGRQMVLSKVVDDELASNQVKAREILNAHDTFAVFSSPFLASGWPDLTNAGVPIYTAVANSPDAVGHDSIYPSPGVACISCPNRTYAYAGKLAGATHVASLGYGVNQASKDCVAGQVTSVEKYAPETGQQVAYKNDDLPFGLPNGVGPEVTAMKDAGVDFIMTCLDLNGTKTLAQELKRQGMGDVTMSHPNSYDPAFIAQSGDLFEGDIVGVQVRPFEANVGNTTLGDYLKWIKDTGGEPSETSAIAWVNADLAYKGLLAAGPQFDQASVIKATNRITDFTGDGMIPPVDWSRQHEPPSQDDLATHGPAQQCYAYVRIHSGKFELVGDADKPFYCWPGSTYDWSDPVQTDFK
jgi:ABC-type branched-subunit amino acid transport system substrate-binding protein